MIKACLFDLDGTLLDTLTTIKYYIDITAEKYGLPSITLDETRLFVGKGAANLVNRIFERYGIDYTEGDGKTLRDAFFEAYVSSYDSDPQYLTAPYERIPELVETLRSSGVKLAVISNKPDTAVKPIIASIFPCAFEIVEGGREGVPLKPDPTAPLEICKRLGVLPSEVAYIGDTGTDMRTGVKMGAALNIGVKWGFRDEEELIREGATHTVSSPDEIKALVLNG